MGCARASYENHGVAWSARADQLDAPSCPSNHPFVRHPPLHASCFLRSQRGQGYEMNFRNLRTHSCKHGLCWRRPLRQFRHSHQPHLRLRQHACGAARVSCSLIIFKEDVRPPTVGNGAFGNKSQSIHRQSHMPQDIVLETSLGSVSFMSVSRYIIRLSCSTRPSAKQPRGLSGQHAARTSGPSFGWISGQCVRRAAMHLMKEKAVSRWLAPALTWIGYRSKEARILLRAQ